MSISSDVLVIGGGINGVSIAYNLSKKGASVTLLEKSFIAGGPSGRSSAIIRQHYSNRVTAQMALRSLRIWQNFDDAVGGNPEFIETGFLIGVQPKDVEGLKANLELQNLVGINSQFLTPEEILEIEPNADTSELGGAAYEPEGGYADPAAAANAYASAAQRLGATIHTQVAVTGIRIERGQAVGVESEEGFFPAGSIIVSAGPWSPSLMQKLGIDLPVAATRIKVGICRRPEDLDYHCTWGDFINKVYFRPETGRLTMIGSIDPEEETERIPNPDQFNERADMETMVSFGERISRRLPAMERSHLVSSYASLYDITPDWHSIMDAIPGYSNVFICAGSSGHGFKLAPAVGEMMANLVLEGKSKEDDIQLFSFNRFEHDNEVKGQYAYSILG